MKHDHFFDSTMLQSVSYDDTANEMTVTFANGKDYVYEDVGFDIFEQLISAESAGKYFNSVKGQLKVKKDSE